MAFAMQYHKYHSTRPTEGNERNPRRHARLCAGLLTTALMAATAAPARAELKICNTTPARVGVAIGYQDQKGWATEGWWNVSARSCETLLKDKVPSRYIYVYAIDYERGGEWAGEKLMCTGEKAFIIRDVTKCRDRGYQQSGFYEIDTGDAANWTIKLSDPEQSAKPATQ